MKKTILLLTTLVFVVLVPTAPAEVVVRDADWVRQRVRQWQPTPDEKRWESIGWAEGLDSALKLARRHRRPVFLFTLDGRMNVGRC